MDGRTTAWPIPRQGCSFLDGGALPDVAELVALDPAKTVADTPVADDGIIVGRLPDTMRKVSKLILLSGALALIAAACGNDDASPDVSTAPTVASTSTTTATASTTTTAATSTTSAVLTETPVATDVTETYTIPGFGFSIDYPVGWFVETRGPITVIAQTEEQLQARFADPIPPRVALGVNLDHRTVAFLQSIGLTADDPTAQDLLDFNTRNFDWTDVQDLGEVDVFGTTAVVVRVTNPDGDFAIEYQGVRPDTGEIFLFGYGAPTEESLNAFLPAWEAMFESITASDLSVEELVGTWRCGECGSFLQFSEDGTYRILLSVEDTEGSTVEQGQFTLEGTLFTFISNEDSRNCGTGDRGSYEIEALENGPSGENRMEMIQVSDECSTRGSVGDVTIEQVPESRP